MTTLADLKPRTKERVMDLFERAGIDVSDWANYELGATNPAANPKYCYEWALKQPHKVVVCNLWFGNMREIDGQIEQHLPLADSATKRETNTTRRSRRRRMAELLVEAYIARLPIRVIILDGQTRESSEKGKTRVTGRSLDAASVTYGSASSGGSNLCISPCSRLRPSGKTSRRRAESV